MFARTNLSWMVISRSIISSHRWIARQILPASSLKTSACNSRHSSAKSKPRMLVQSNKIPSLKHTWQDILSVNEISESQDQDGSASRESQDQDGSASRESRDQDGSASRESRDQDGSASRKSRDQIGRRSVSIKSRDQDRSAFRDYKCILEKIEKQHEPHAVLKQMVENLDPCTITTGFKKLANIKEKYNENFLEFLKTEEFFTIEQFCKKNAAHFSDTENSICHKALCSCTPDDITLVKFFAGRLHSKLPRMSFYCLMRVAHACKNHLTSPSRKELLFRSKSVLSKRLVEVCKPSEIISLLYLFDKSDHVDDDSIIMRIEDIAFNVVETMTSEEKYKVFYVLSKHKSRNLPLLKILIDGISNDFLEKEEVTSYTSLLYSCFNLSLYEYKFLLDVSSCLVLKSSTRTPVYLLISALRTLAGLRFRKEDVVNDLFSKIINNENKVKLSSSQVSKVMTSLAILNIVPQHIDEVKPWVKNCEAMNENDPEMWLNIVWSMLVLKLADADMIASVLNKQFCDCLDRNIDKHKMLITNIKLLNIDFAAEHEVEQYRGDRLQRDITVEKSQIQGFVPAVVDSVLKTVNLFAPKGYSICQDAEQFVKQGGHIIDTELFVDNLGKPLPYEESLTDSLRSKHRIAIRTIGFQGMTFPEQVPRGENEMADRHLKKLGYRVVQVLDSEWSNLSTKLDKVQFLEKKIRDAIKESS